MSSKNQSKNQYKSQNKNQNKNQYKNQNKSRSNNNSESYNGTRKKNRRIRRLKLYIRRALFLIIFILIIYLCIYFVIKGFSTFFRGSSDNSDKMVSIEENQTRDNTEINNNETDETDKSGEAEKKEETDKTDETDETGKSDENEKTDKSGEAGKSDENNETDKTDETDKSEKADSGKNERNKNENSGITREELILSGTIYDGIFIDELDVSEMDFDTAVEEYNKYIKESLKRKVTFTDSLGSYDTTFNALEMQIDVEKAVTDALNYGRSGNILGRYKEIENLKENNVTLIPEKTVEADKLEELLSLEATELVKDPVSSSMVRSDGEFIVYESEKGLGIDYEKTTNELNEELKKKWENKAITFKAVTKEIEPAYTEEDFYGVDTLLGRCVTEYNVKNEERIINLQVGAHKIADHVLLPGQQFSVYDTVSPFTEENGYHNAGQYINAELVDGLGGGICQVATTLYGAVLESELQVDERYPHSMTVSYVEKGMDAAIAEGYEDFKFTNNTDYPIYIDAYAGGGYISVAIYGHETRSAGRRIEFDSQIIETYEPGEEKTIYDDTLPSGTTNVTYAHTGYYVEVWKNIYQDGELVDSVKINGSEYQAVPKTTRIGTMTE